jgi:hypothetical protein
METEVARLRTNMEGWPQSAPGPLILTRFVSKVGFELFPGVVAKLGKAVEALQPDVELGRS